MGIPSGINKMIYLSSMLDVKGVVWGKKEQERTIRCLGKSLVSLIANKIVFKFGLAIFFFFLLFI